MRLIDVDKIKDAKFHGLPHTHIITREAEPESYMLGWNDAIDAIAETAPTIEPEQKHGRWIETEQDDPCFYRCSECARLIDDKTRFCPNCGCAMIDGEKDGES